MPSSGLDMKYKELLTLLLMTIKTPVRVLDSCNYFPDSFFFELWLVESAEAKSMDTETVHHRPSASVYIKCHRGDGEIAQWPGMLAGSS